MTLHSLSTLSLTRERLAWLCMIEPFCPCPLLSLSLHFHDMLTDGPSPASFLLQLICRPATLSLLRTHKYRVKERESLSVIAIFPFRCLMLRVMGYKSQTALLMILSCLSLSFSFPLCLPFHVTMRPCVLMSFVQTKHTESWSCVRLHKTTTNKNQMTTTTSVKVSTWFANARRRLKKENKMTWEPRNKATDDGHDSGNDKDSIMGSDGEGSSDATTSTSLHGNATGTGTTARTLVSERSIRAANGHHHHQHQHQHHHQQSHHHHGQRSDHANSSNSSNSSSSSPPILQSHYPIVKTEGLTTITDLTTAGASSGLVGKSMTRLPSLHHQSLLTHAASLSGNAPTHLLRTEQANACQRMRE